MRCVAIAVLIVLAGCAEEPPADTAAVPPDATSAEPVPDPQADQALLEMPPGGHSTWIADMKTGLSDVLAQVPENRGAALNATQLLFTSRQSHLRAYYGEGGSEVASPEMAEAIGRADMYFHELMRILASNDVEMPRIEETVAALQEALTDTETAGQAAGLPPEAPR